MRKFKRFPTSIKCAEYDIRKDLAKTAKSDNVNDRLYVAQFPYTPKNILEQLLDDAAEKVRTAAQKTLDKQSKRKRTATFLGDPITCSATRNMSILSFDFLHNGYYDESAIEDAVSEALEFCGCHLEAIDFHEVDYGGYPEYEGEQISQCSCDFSWDYDYDTHKIEDALELTMSHLDSSEGGDVIGIDFESYV